MKWPWRRRLPPLSAEQAASAEKVFVLPLLEQERVLRHVSRRTGIAPDRLALLIMAAQVQALGDAFNRIDAKSGEVQQVQKRALEILEMQVRETDGDAPWKESGE